MSKYKYLILGVVLGLVLGGSSIALAGSGSNSIRWLATRKDKDQNFNVYRYYDDYNDAGRPRTTCYVAAAWHNNSNGDPTISCVSKP